MRPVLARLTEVADILEQHDIDAVFVGGAVLPLLVDELVRAELRPTLDIDVVVRADSYSAYQSLCQPLLRAGFTPGGGEHDPMCRYRRDDLTVDVMPVPFEGVGTDNPWFSEAMVSREHVDIRPGHPVAIAAPPVYLATKVAAFRGRGKADYFGSKDIEDIVALLDGRPGLPQEVRTSSPAIRRFLVAWAKDLLEVPYIEDTLSGHLARGAGPGREAILMDRLRELAGLEDDRP